MKQKYTSKDLVPIKLYPDAKKFVRDYQAKHGLKNPSLAIVKAIELAERVEAGQEG